MSIRLPYRCARDDTSRASENGLRSIGWMATSGTKLSVFAMAVWAAAMESIEVLSLYTRAPR